MVAEEGVARAIVSLQAGANPPGLLAVAMTRAAGGAVGLDNGGPRGPGGTVSSAAAPGLSVDGWFSTGGSASAPAGSARASSGITRATAGSLGTTGGTSRAASESVCGIEGLTPHTALKGCFVEFAMAALPERVDPWPEMTHGDRGGGHFVPGGDGPLEQGGIPTLSGSRAL